MMKRIFLVCALMSIFALPLAGLDEVLPERFSFQRYAPLLNAVPFTVPGQLPMPTLAIKGAIKNIEWNDRGVRIFLYDGRILENVRPVPSVLEDGILYPVLPPKRPKQ
jgi:hypothetical protein